MSVVVSSSKVRSEGSAQSQGICDCDIHTALPSREALKPYLGRRWHRQYDILPGRSPSGGYYSSRPQAHIFRVDSHPPTGGPPGSDLDFLRQQHLDTWDIAHGVLSPLEMLGWPQEGEFSAALHAALNDWTQVEWLDREPRLHGTIAIPVEDPVGAAAEIRRLGANARFVQVLMLGRMREPIGSPKYWPIYEAATGFDLPVTVHVGGSGGPFTGAGWPSYHLEAHVAFAQTYIAHVISSIHSGVFAEFPTLQFVLEEAGISWMPALMWRLDRAHEIMRADVPHITQKPSQTIRDHFWFTTQPMDEPDDPSHFAQMLDHLDMDDRVMFASDYPHWDFDAPDRALPRTLAPELRRSILRSNAQALFGFGDGSGGA